MALKERAAQLKPVSRFEAQKLLKLKQQQSKNKVGLKFENVNGSDEQLTDLEIQQEDPNNYTNAFVEDSRRSGFTFKMLMHVQCGTLLMVIISIMGSLLQNDFLSSGHRISLKITLCSQSIITIMLITMILFRYKLVLRMGKDQKVENPNRTLLNGDYIYYVILQCLIILPHPNIACIDSTTVLFEPFDSVYLDHRTNDLLALFMLLRCYIIVRTLVFLTIYSGPRASRLCRLYGCEHKFMFSIKCIMQETPLKALMTMFLLTLLVFGHGLKISEQNVVAVVPQTYFDLAQYENCLWCIIITMGTIGYGDYYPKTYPGRIITILAAVTGVIMSSLLIITLNAYLSLDTNENKAHITLQRLKIRGLLQKMALETVKTTTQVSFNLKSDKQQQLKQSFQNLRKKAQEVKIMMRKLQTVVETDNVNQQMYRLFQILKVNMKQIYMNQLQVKDLLSQLYHREKRRLRNMKFTFTNEIQSMIKEA